MMIRPRLATAKKAIRQPLSQQQTGGTPTYQAPQVAAQSSAQAPTTNTQTNAVYRPIGGGTAPAAGTNIAPISAGANIARAGVSSASLNNIARPTMGDQSSLDRFYTDVRQGNEYGFTNTLPGVSAGDAPPPYLRGEEQTPTANVDVAQPEADRSSQEILMDLVRERLAGLDGAGISDEERALIEEQVNNKLGGDLRNQRASAGASGFEASGALMGMEGDIRRSAALDAVNQITAANEREQRQAYEEAMGLLGAQNDERRLAFEEQYRQDWIDALNAWLAGEGGADPGIDPEDGNDPGIDFDPSGDVNAKDASPWDYAIGNVSNRARQENDASAQRYASDTEARQNATTLSSASEVPPGAEYVDSDSQYRYYRDADGKYYRVRAASFGANSGGAAPYDPNG